MYATPDQLRAFITSDPQPEFKNSDIGATAHELLTWADWSIKVSPAWVEKTAAALDTVLAKLHAISPEMYQASVEV